MTKLDSEERKLLLEDGGGQRRHTCPECRPAVEFPSLEAMGSHLERHSPVEVAEFHPKTKEPLTKPCCKGCGRHFPIKGQKQRRYLHETMCDGSAPLPSRVKP
ncbi:MAG TPA: hypothetical protein VJU16_07300 [Planctomycetota bacterium]|nr:hypothetical protein [Planctomycetota bacterium]